MDKKSYVVRFLILKKIETLSLDNLSAEIDAANLLPLHERECVMGVQVCSPEDLPTTNFKEFAHIDQEWWEDQGLFSLR